MRTKLRISANQTGLTVYCVIRNEDDEIKDSTGFVTFNASNYGDYDIPMTEQGSSKYYSVTFPTDISTVGWYHITYQARVGVSPDQSDDVIHQELIYWNGLGISTTIVTGTSITDICNMALAHLGHTKQIDNFETEQTEAARLCRRFYETARDETLRAYPWSFATVIETLGLVEEDPTDEWAFSYRYPSDSLKARRILSGTRNDTRQSRVPYKIIKDDTGLLIYTDKEDAILEYTITETNPSFYQPDFIMALSFLLAFYIAPALSRGDKFKLGERALQMYMDKISTASANDGNEGQIEELPSSEFERSRA